MISSFATSDTVLLVGGEVDNYLHPAIANVEVDLIWSDIWGIWPLCSLSLWLSTWIISIWSLAGGWTIHYYDNLFIFFLQAVGPCTTWIICLFFLQAVGPCGVFASGVPDLPKPRCDSWSCTMNIFGKYVEIFWHGLTLANCGWWRPILLVKRWKNMQIILSGLSSNNHIDDWWW